MEVVVSITMDGIILGNGNEVMDMDTLLYGIQDGDMVDFMILSGVLLIMVMVITEGITIRLIGIITVTITTTDEIVLHITIQDAVII